MGGLRDDPIGFWDQRHAALDPWRAGGDRGLSPEENYEFYLWRVGRMIELIRRHGGARRPLRMVDAGCGRGHFTDFLRRCGHQVIGIDSSAAAVAWAREHYGPHFEQCGLEAFAPAAPVDVVLCIDVLYHLLDDRVWHAALTAFAGYCAPGALLLISSVFPAQRFQLGDYIVHRSLAEHESALADAGFTMLERVPYEFAGNPNQFAVCRRAP
jgi:2-polyprenyl-3-methyl-5-hydroxy-6-metoxy-1,4-benzoquinol methylase